MLLAREATIAHMQGGPTHRVVLYARAGCHLCDVARDTIESQRERLGFDFSEIDIEADEELELEYGIRIPVVEVDGEEVFETSVDAEKLARLVG
jgi:glutaredoxin